MILMRNSDMKLYKIFSLALLENTAISQTLLNVSNINSNTIRIHILIVTFVIHKSKQLRSKSQSLQMFLNPPK